MAEMHDHALLLRRIPYGDTSLICHFLTEQHGRIALMARGAKRPKSVFRASLEPLYALNITWRPGRSGMGTLTDVQRGSACLAVSQSMDGLELLAIASRLFHEGDHQGFEEVNASLQLLASSHAQRLLMAVWQLLDAAGWLGDLSHCWQCGSSVDQEMYWRQAQLVCAPCGGGMTISTGLRKSIVAVLSGQQVRFSIADASSWSEMIRQVLMRHDIRLTDSFRK
ncbi:DNA repair protein RecO [Mariprofundus sp. EBB-1]|uniref:DNA repair protein RecO n=1 Tax=Mariprofundus sp. EBB-1 TaxID=2650971 RepID=UPI000EF1C191|nr:DNA repair protein RecO [Mariprofundus sp. EBB-1]RLL55956.1 DNA repair protein RecO [Mariprofundus sp. EBB-1]